MLQKRDAKEGKQPEQSQFWRMVAEFLLMKSWQIKSYFYWEEREGISAWCTTFPLTSTAPLADTYVAVKKKGSQKSKSRCTNTKIASTFLPQCPTAPLILCTTAYSATTKIGKTPKHDDATNWTLPCWPSYTSIEDQRAKCMVYQWCQQSYKD